MAKVVRRKDINGRVLPEGVYYRQTDNRYIYKYSLYGQPHYIYDKDLTELKKKIDKNRIDVASGRNTDLASMSLNEWYPQYIKIFKEDKVKPASLLNLKNYYEWYVEPYAIGRMPMRELKRTHFVAHFRELVNKKKLAHGTLRSLASMLYNCLQQVVYDGGLFVNPASEIMKDVAAKPKEARDALTEEQEKLLLDFLKIEGTFQNVYLPMVGILLGTGMRFGECDALTWDDVDLEKCIVHVSKTLNYRCKNTNKHEYFITSPKTPNAVRDIPLSDDLVRLFKMQKQYQKDMRIRQDIKIDGYSQFVFTSKLGNPFTHEGFVATMKRIVKHANEWEKERAEKEDREPVELPAKLTPHIFRHTFATHLVLNEVPYEIAKVIMGHSSVKTTIDIYSHIRNDNAKRMRADIGNVIKIFD